MRRAAQLGRRAFLTAGLGPLWARGTPSRVVVARRPSLRPKDSADLLKLLDGSVQAFFGAQSPAEAWRLLARSGETIGLKVNCLAGRGASTSPLLVEAIAERLRQAGTPAGHIVVWDRLNADLESAGFPVGQRRDGMLFIGNDSAGYEDELSIFGASGSLLSRTLTRRCDTIVNLPVLKDHGIVGVTMALKNLFGAIHNPNKYHLRAGDPYVAEVNAMPQVRRKLGLTICDALTAQCEGGPSFMPQWGWAQKGLLVARDPVAHDFVGWQLIEQQRAVHGLPTLKAAGREPRYIATAAGAGHALGTNDPRSIERLDVEF